MKKGAGGEKERIRKEGERASGGMDKGNGGAQKDKNREERKRLEGEIETWKERGMEREGDMKRLGKMACI